MINEKLSHYMRKKTILHEIAHIELNQLNQIDKDLIALKIAKYEDEADKYINFLLHYCQIDKMEELSWKKKK